MASSTPVDEIFLTALEKATTEERKAFLDEACQNDSELRRRVERLLEAHPHAQGFLERSPDHLQATTHHGPVEVVNDLAGTVIAGRYKLMEEIAEGGMGTVWVAEQLQPLRRRVAIKLIKPGMDSRRVLSRFDVERQALALMDHPSIAKVLDGGVTEQGRPFFVMEYVKGVPITEYCDQARLSVKERLLLFVQVCRAVQHAHQKGIVHRDLKPSNILVCLYDGEPVPKVIDFGLAKALHQPLTEHTLDTAFGVMVGTPLYMSPEQAEFNNLDIDTRSDVYSLGVLLYELLTGTTPLEKERLREAAMQEILRLIKEEEPAKPSSKLSGSSALASIAVQRSLEPAQLSRAIRGDLDWIVMKSLEKERSRRYETANGLARDIERYLHDEPVEASPPTARYRFRKFARRNRAGLAMAGLVTVFLAAGTVVSTWQAIRATRAEHRADSERLVAERARVTEAQQRRIAEVQRNEADAARASETEQRRIAVSERSEAEKQRAAAEANFQKARAAVDKYFTLVSESKLFDVPGMQPLRQELMEAALEFYRESSNLRTNDPAVLADLAATYLRIGLIYQALGRADDWIGATRDALDVIDTLQRQHPKPNPHEIKLAGFWKGLRLGTLNVAPPRNALGALTTLSRLDRVWTRLGEQHPEVVGFRHDRAAIKGFLYLVYIAMGQMKTSEKYSLEGRAILEGLVRDYPQEPEYRQNLAIALQTLTWDLGNQGRKEEAQKLARRAVELGEELVLAVPKNATYRNQLVESLMTLDRQLSESQRKESGMANLRRAMQVAEQNVREFPNEAIYQNQWLWATETALELASKNSDQAQLELTLRSLIRYFSFLVGQAYEQSNPRVRLATALCRLARSLESDPKKSGQAEDLRRQALTVLKEHLENIAPGDNQALNSFAWQIVERAPIDPLLAEFALPIAQRAAEGAPEKGHIQNTLGVVYFRAGQYEKAVETLLLARQSEGSNIAVDGYFLAMAYAKLNEMEKALRWFRAAEAFTTLTGTYNRFFSEAAEALGQPTELSKRGASEPEGEQRVVELSLAADPQEARWVYAWLADRAVTRGDWETARERFAEAIIHTPDKPWLHYAHALVHLQLIDGTGYRAACQAMSERFASTSDTDTRHWLVWTCCLAPEAVGDFTPVLQHAEQLVQQAPGRPEHFEILGALLYRAGRYTEAAEHLAAAVEMLTKQPSERTTVTYSTLFLAMTQHQLGRADEAREWLTKAQAALKKEKPETMPWMRKVTLELLSAEAEREIGEKS